MHKRTLYLALTLALAMQTGNIWAATAVSTQFKADSKAAQTRYNSDKKLCNDETSSKARLQCRRDAKAEYDQAIAAAKAAAAPTPAPAKLAALPCEKCGRVLSIAVTEKAGEASAVGVIAGGALGAVLGHQVGGGVGKDLATLAGAAGGAYAGKVIEEKVKTHKVWIVTVVYANESKASFNFAQDPGFHVGDPVKNAGGSIARL
ncbi:MAG: glycine zipper 2TM domain-containing protein [Rhodoferax sp.]